MKKSTFILLPLFFIGQLHAQPSVVADTVFAGEQLNRIHYLKKMGCYCKLVRIDSSEKVATPILIEEYKRLKKNGCDKSSVYTSADMVALVDLLSGRILGNSVDSLVNIFGRPTYEMPDKYLYQFGKQHIFFVMEFRKEKLVKTKWDRISE